MTTVDFSDWPIVTVVLADDPPRRELAALVGGVQSALERRERFGLAIITSPAMVAAQLEDPPPMRWLQQRRAETGTWCHGVAYVFNQDLAPAKERHLTSAAKRVWGCHIHITRDRDDAISWLAARIGSDARR